MDVTRELTEFIKIWLAGGGMLLALLWAWIPRQFASNALVFLTLLAGVNYARWGPESSVERVDAYDVLHYYINAKYFEELGYYDLYPAIILADMENGGPFFKGQGDKYMAQDENGHAIQSIAHGIARGKVVKQNFTPEDWQQFSHDVLYLQRDLGCRLKIDGKCRVELSDELWRQMLQDHGFNGTTAWTVLAEPFAKLVPVEYVKLLGYLDVALLGAGLALIAWAYGGTAAWFTALWFLVGYTQRWPYLSWVFLRYDWVFALMAATALLKKGHPLLAGVFAGWTATLRMFPALWMWGPFAKGLAGLTRKHVSRPLLVLAGGFFLGVAVFEGVAVVRYGTEPIEVHFENMLDHNDPMQLSSRRIGLAMALSQQENGYLHKYITTRQKKKIEEQKPLRYGLAILAILGIGWGVRRARDDEAYAYGFLPFFLLTTASYYYYVARITMIMVHAGDLTRWRNRVGLAFLFGLEVFSNAAQVYEPVYRMFLIGNLAIGLAVYTLGAVVWMNWEAVKAPTDEGA